MPSARHFAPPARSKPVHPFSRYRMMPTPKHCSPVPARPATLALTVLVLLSGCSLIDAKKDDYKRANRLPPLEIPPTLSQPSADDRYTIPDPKDVAASATYSEYAKSRGLPTVQGGYVPGVGVDPQSAQAHLEVAGSQRWLVVNGTPDQVFNTIKTFLTENGYEIGAEDAALGVIETQWIEGRPQVEDDGIFRNLIHKVFSNDNSTSIRDRYKFRIDRGRKDGTCEIYVSQKGLEEVVAGQDRTVWQPRASEPDKEAEMLKRLLLKFGVDIPAADQQLAKAQPAERQPSADAAEAAAGGAAVATGAPGAASGAVRVVTGSDGQPALVMGEGFDRAWRRTSLAIDKSGLALQDQDRDSGWYFVQYSADKVKDPAGEADKSAGVGGFFSKLGHAIWSKITDTDTSGKDSSKPVDLSPQAKLSDIKVPDGTYRLALSNDPKDARMTVLDKDGKAPPADVSRKLLAVLAAQLR